MHQIILYIFYFFTLYKIKNNIGIPYTNYSTDYFEVGNISGMPLIY
jgi:hypothetical protein